GRLPSRSSSARRPSIATVRTSSRSSGCVTVWSSLATRSATASSILERNSRYNPHLVASVRLRFLGSGDAFASGGRSHTCFLLDGGLEPLLIDCGPTALVALKREHIDPASIGTVALSHLHGDHFGGLPWLVLDGQFADRTRPLLVGGPPGTETRF